MNSKIIKKIIAYAKQHELDALSISQKDGHQVLYSENGLTKHQLKLPRQLENELSLAYKKLLAIAPNDLASDVYFKDNDSAFKISIIPDEDNEKILINAVAKNKKIMPLSHLGMGRQERKLIETYLKKRSGLIVIGSNLNQGKTTTLYSLLQKIDKVKKVCYILEKNSELEIDGVNKIISSGEKRLSDLNRVLKSDSEVIAIDDANSELLAESLKAALTGRLVIVSTTSNDALSLVEKVKAITTNEDFKILLIYQRLLLKNCPHCLKAYLVNESGELITKYWPSEKKYKPKRFFSNIGCPRCNHAGVKGQIASFNLIEINKKEINILSTLASDILQKAANGLISVSKYLSEHKSSEKKL